MRDVVARARQEARDVADSIATADAAYERAIAAVRSDLESGKARAARTREAAIREAEAARHLGIAAAEEAHASRVAKLTALRDRRISKLNEAVVEVVAQATRHEQRLGLYAAPWTADAWRSFSPATGYHSPREVRLGTITLGDASLPHLAPFAAGPGLLLVAGDGADAAVKAAAQGVMVRLLAGLPAGQVHHVFVDPVGRGDNVAAFMQLADHDPQLVTHQAWTEEDQIARQLRDLTARIEYVIQRRLRTDFGQFEEYLAHPRSVPEPYKVLVVFDFPVGFSQGTAQRLISIARAGPRCGVFPIVVTRDGAPMPREFSLQALSRHCTTIRAGAGGHIWAGEDCRLSLSLDPAPPLSLVRKVVSEVGPRAVGASDVKVPFSQIAIPESDRWTGRSDEALSVPVGPAGAHKDQHVTLGRNTAQHVLIAGRTGSGKSTLLHALLVNLETRPPLLKRALS